MSFYKITKKKLPAPNSFKEKAIIMIIKNDFKNTDLSNIFDSII